MNEEQRRKDNCRSYANVYKRRGKITRLPCERCGSAESQMHHEDYSRPLDVTWLCRPCHLAHHEEEAERAKPALIAALNAEADAEGTDWAKIGAAIAAE